MSKRVVVAIDGPAGSGKSTVARRVAAKLGFVYIDTGAMYRAVALGALRAGIPLDDTPRLEALAANAAIAFEPGGGRVFLNGEDVTAAIREEQVAAAASKAAAVPGVRRALVEQQRRMGAETSVVMEGRDIGTVVFPEAEVKVFLDASPEARAERRLRELREKGVPAEGEDVERELRQRDERDSRRAESPLMRAPDAAYLDTSGLSLEEVEQAILRIFHERVPNGKEFLR